MNLDCYLKITFIWLYLFVMSLRKVFYILFTLSLYDVYDGYISV